MEDSFRVRVDRAFGSLGNLSPSLWSLTDEEIERRQWNRNKDDDDDDDEDDEFAPSVVRPEIESDLQNLSDCDVENNEEEIDGEKQRRRQCSVAENIADEHWDVQSNIGLDFTLDYEEEEDEYDKVAVGMEQTGDRLYTRDLKFAESGVDEINTYGELPNSFRGVAKDPRANHVAAKIRLEEDAEAAGSFDTLQLSENSVTTNVETVNHMKRELDEDSLKSILKKRNNLMDSRSHKRVRFSFDPKSSLQNHEEEHQPSGASDSATETCSNDKGAVPEQAPGFSHNSSCVPDYIRNPSKYTHYTFDPSEDINDQSNKKAYMDFFHELRKRSTDYSLQDDTLIDIPKSVMFTPRRKPEDDSMVKNSKSDYTTGDSVKNKSCSIAVAVEESQETEVSAMEEDEPCTAAVKGCSLQRRGRQYRTRNNVDSDDNLT